MPEPSDPPDDQLITYLARGFTKAQAAQASGVSVRTVYRRLAAPDFVARVREARQELFDAAIGRLTAAAADAALTLQNLSAPSAAVDPKIKVAASKGVFDNLARLRSTVELADEVAELRQMVEELKRKAGKR